MENFTQTHKTTYITIRISITYNGSYIFYKNQLINIEIIKILFILYAC